MTSDELSIDFTVPFTVWLAGVAAFFEAELACGAAANAVAPSASAPASTNIRAR
jgi:hypothetical protein